jgi:DNA-binding CsgD family transcriptional regulator
MPEHLTRREIQCVRLAGESLSNKEIAARLRLSPRTVNNHLSSAYAKLSTSNRHDAAAAVARDYPDFSRFQPIPIETHAALLDGRSRPGGEPATTFEAHTVTWRLPPPPQGLATRLLIMLGLAVVAAVITIGLVAIVEASLASFNGYAPPNAVQAPKSG